MARIRLLLPALLAGTVLLATPLLAQVQSQPLPPPSGTPSAPPAPSATPPSTPTPPAAPTPSTKTEPAKTPTPGTKPAKPAQAATCPDDKVDVNSASADSLKKLPQIGTQRANAIVKARPYAAPEDLVKKKVLKKAVYDKIRSCITASGVAPSAPVAKGVAPAAKTPSGAPVPLPTPAAEPKQ